MPILFQIRLSLCYKYENVYCTIIYIRYIAHYGKGFAAFSIPQIAYNKVYNTKKNLNLKNFNNQE